LAFGKESKSLGLSNALSFALRLTGRAKLTTSRDAWLAGTLALPEIRGREDTNINAHSDFNAIMRERCLRAPKDGIPQQKEVAARLLPTV
jgi:hypothetical protein